LSGELKEKNIMAQRMLQNHKICCTKDYIFIVRKTGAVALALPGLMAG